MRIDWDRIGCTRAALCCVCAQGALVALKPIYKQKIDIPKPLLMEIKKVQCVLSLVNCHINSYATPATHKPLTVTQPQRHVRPHVARPCHVPLSRHASAPLASAQQQQLRRPSLTSARLALRVESM